MQSDPDSKRLRRVALTAISIATLLVLATGASCAGLAIGGPKIPKGPNQTCDVCHDAASNSDIQMQLYVFVPGQPLMDDFTAGEKMLQGADSTAMGFSSRGCLPPSPVPYSLGTDAGVSGQGGYVNVFQPGPPPPRSGLDSAPTPPKPGEPPPKHDCNPPPGKKPLFALCQEPLGDDGILQPDGVVYFKAITKTMNDYRFIPCKYARDNKIRSYADVARLAADQWIHFTGTHQGKGPVTWSLTRQP